MPGTLPSRRVARAPPVPARGRAIALISLTCWAIGFDSPAGRGVGLSARAEAARNLAGLYRRMQSGAMGSSPRLRARQRDPVVEGDAAVDGDRRAGDVAGEAVG